MELHEVSDRPGRQRGRPFRPEHHAAEPPARDREAVVGEVESDLDSSSLFLGGDPLRRVRALAIRTEPTCKLIVDNSQQIAYAANRMIRSFRSKPLAELWEKGRTSKINAKMHERILRRLDRLDAAAVPEEMNIPGLDFHALRGFKPMRYSVHVNGPWCITFEFEDGDACRVAFEQYH